MGNQQLLLLVLGTIVVAIAVVVGITEFRAYHIEAVGDEMQSTILTLSAEAKVHFNTPKTLGGGGGSFEGFYGGKTTREIGSLKYMIVSFQDAVTTTGMSGYGYLACEVKHTNGNITLNWFGFGSYKDRTKTAVTL